MANKPVDPTSHIEAVDEFLRRNESTIRNLAQREAAAAANNKPTETLPTSTSNSNIEKGSATKTLKVIENLKVENGKISEEHQAVIQNQRNQRPNH